MSDNFFAEFARPYAPPPGFELVDDKDYPPPPRQTTARGLLTAGASGLNAGLAGTLGGPVDIANTALRGAGLETSKTPILGRMAAAV